MRDSEVFALAGLWVRWEGEGEFLDSCPVVNYGRRAEGNVIVCLLSGIQEYEMLKGRDPT